LFKIRHQFKTLKKAFTELDRRKQGHITKAAFEEIIESWGFEATREQVDGIFDWLDADKDQIISYMDLKKSLGTEITPQETFFFRQDSI
jgi:Ca2+-binding EF-hand superfamily protein